MNRGGKPKLACPSCGYPVSRVIDGRDDAGMLTGFWRRRECRRCKIRYTTEEVIRGTYQKSASSSR